MRRATVRRVRRFRSPHATLRLGEVNDRQRILLVMALGLTIAVVVGTWDATIRSNGDGGWFAYAPNTNSITSFDNAGDILGRGVMGLGGVVVWAGSSFWILRGRRPVEDNGSG